MRNKMAASRLRNIFSFLLFLSAVSAQTEVNILILHDSNENNLPIQAIESAIKFLEKNPAQGAVVNKQYTMAMKNGDDIEKTVNATCDIMDSAIDAGAAPHFILDATNSGVMSETAKSFTRALGLPTFSASYGHTGDLREWRGLSDSEKQYLVQLMPVADIIPQAIRDIIRSQNITNAAIIYDDSFEFDHKYKSLLQNLPCRHIMISSEMTITETRAQLERLKNADIVNFFAVGGMKTVTQILNAADANSMFGRKYAWYTLTKELGDVQCGCSKVALTSMKPMTDSEIKSRMNMLRGSYGLTATPEVDAAFYFDYAIRGILAAGAMVKNGKYDNFEFLKCSAFDEKNPPARTGFDFRTALKEVQMIDSWSDITWGENGLSYPNIPLEMAKISISRGKRESRKGIGEWAAGMPGNIMFKAGQNLDDQAAITVYRITTVVQPPFIMTRQNETTGKLDYYGYCIDLIDEIKKIINFEYEISEAPDQKFGSMNDNGDWNGMILELINNRADIALAPLSVMAERENVVDFTVPYYDLVGITIMMRKPEIATSLFRFLTVLETEVWLCILAAYAATSILLWAFDYFSPYSYQNNREKYEDDEEKREFSIKECFWFCMTSLTPQGGGEAPKNLSGRLVAATWWLFGFIIIASYTANLAAFLTVSRLDTPIESLTDLSNQYKIQYSPMNGSSTMTYFERMAYIERKFYEIWKDMSLDDTMDPVDRAKLAVWDYPVSDKYTKMWQSMQEAGLPPNFESAMERVRGSQSNSEGFAYLGDATDIRYQVLTNCDLEIIGEEFSRKPYAIAVQQGSPLKDQFNDAILKLLNQRKLETLKERWWNQNPEKKACDKDDDQSDGISIENIGGVFIVIFVGIGLACVTLGFEYWWYKSKKQTRITDSGRVLPVKEFDNGKERPSFTPDKTNFNTDFKNANYDMGTTPTVPTPW